jgi:arylsulfatase
MKANLPCMLALLGASLAAPAAVVAQAPKPNILVIFGDDIGIANVNAYSDGLMGYTTPNIDRLANEGIRFLHYYGEQSCTAGRGVPAPGRRSGEAGTQAMRGGPWR